MSQQGKLRRSGAFNRFSLFLCHVHHQGHLSLRNPQIHFPNLFFPLLQPDQRSGRPSSPSCPLLSCLTNLRSSTAYCQLAHPTILLASSSPRLQALLLTLFSLAWKPIQRKSTSNTFVPSVAASGQVVSFVSQCMTTSRRWELQTMCPSSRMSKTS